MSRTSVSSQVSSASSSPNPFDSFAQSQLAMKHKSEIKGTDGGDPKNFTISPPPASNSDPTVSRHALDSTIVESPVEEEEGAKSTSDERFPAHPRKSAIAKQRSESFQRMSSSASSVHSVDSSSTTTKAKREKSHSLLRKLSGMNIFHHTEKHNVEAPAAETPRVHKPSTSSDKHTRHLAQARAGSVPRPGDPMQIHALSKESPKFSVGESAANSRAASPSTSPHASRTSSVDYIPQATSPSRAGSIAATSIASNDGGSSPVRDHEDFVARAPTKTYSTLSFSRPPLDMRNGSPPTRAASFSHGDTQPVAIPGVPHGFDASPLNSLSRTLSKASLAGGMGWGDIRDKLPTFDSLYTYHDSNDKRLKFDLNGKSGQIGEGAGGVIRTARLKDKCHPAYHPDSRGGDLGLFAVKTFRVQSDGESEGWYCQKLVREFRVHCALKHDNIVKLADICIDIKRRGMKKDEPQFVAVLDFCAGGDLFDLHYHPWNAIDQGVMSKVERNCVFKQLMFAINYMHDRGVAHRDIKLENMLVDGHGQVKLADFGTSTFISGRDGELCRGFVGTDHSVPPEAYLSEQSPSTPKPPYDGLKADIWACAVTWHLLTWTNNEPLAALRAYPFGPEGARPSNKTWQQFMNSIKRHEPNKHIPGWDLYIGSKTESFIGTPAQRQSSIALSASSGHSGRTELDAMFDTSDPNPNPVTDDLKDPLRKCRPFANGFPGSGFTAAKGMLDPDPATRWTARQVLDDPFFSLIDCCQKDSYAKGYDASRERQKKGLQKVHNHIRPSTRKLMEMNKVEQQRNQEMVNARRNEK